MKPKPKMAQAEMQRITEEIVRVLGIDISVALKEYFPGSKFALIIFHADNPKNSNYISNATLDSMTIALKEVIRKNPVGDIKAKKTGHAAISILTPSSELADKGSK